MSNTSHRLKVALLGCGQLADAHLQELARMASVQVTAVCDRHRDLAEQAAARFAVPRVFEDFAALLTAVRPDVVHITSAVPSHCPLTLQALDAGCHVFVEQPFTCDRTEADRVLARAQRAGRQVCVGYGRLFDPLWLDCRDRVARGEIGAVRHVESVLGYSIDGRFGRQVTHDPRHWVRQLPGGLFQNTIAPPLLCITDFLTDSEPQLEAAWSRQGAYDFPTELRVGLRGADVTGSLLFSSTIGPQRITRMHGAEGCLEVDFDAQVIRHRRPPSLPGAFASLQLPWRQIGEAARNLRQNVGRFLRHDIPHLTGLRTLFARFYESILTGGPPPVASAKVRRLSGIMDGIFAECRARDAQEERAGGAEQSAARRAPMPGGASQPCHGHPGVPDVEFSHLRPRTTSAETITGHVAQGPACETLHAESREHFVNDQEHQNHAAADDDDFGRDNCLGNVAGQTAMPVPAIAGTHR